MSNQLLTIGKWTKKWFKEGSRPDARTVKRWIDDGRLDGEVIGGRYYVYEGQNTPVGERPKPAAQDLVNQFKQRRAAA